MKYTNRADLLIAAGESIKMQEKAGVMKPVYKFMCEAVIPISLCGGLNCYIMEEDIEFPLVVVEGKPVFIGDELWHDKYGLVKAFEFKDHNLFSKQSESSYPNCGAIGNYSWNPPKPKTVMVELLVKDAEKLVEWKSYHCYTRVANACTKALGEIK